MVEERVVSEPKGQECCRKHACPFMRFTGFYTWILSHCIELSTQSSRLMSRSIQEKHSATSCGLCHLFLWLLPCLQSEHQVQGGLLHKFNIVMTFKGGGAKIRYGFFWACVDVIGFTLCVTQLVCSWPAWGQRERMSSNHLLFNDNRATKVSSKLSVRTMSIILNCGNHAKLL